MSNTKLSIPTHLGLILDGNRRWAAAQGLRPNQGHLKGYDTLKNIVDLSFEKGIKYVSAYIFSTENWNRSKLEVNFLLNLTLKIITKDLDEMHQKGICIKWLGSEEKVSKKIIQAFRHAEQVTKNNTKGVLALCFNYGGQAEIKDALQRILNDGKDINKVDVADYIYSPEIPPVDFLIRTSGEKRISNFMLWRAAYSELYFTDVLWPDFSKHDLDVALTEYTKRQRRFGG